MEKWQEEIVDRIEEKDEEIINSTSFKVNDENLDFILDHLFLLCTRYAGGRISASKSGSVFEPKYVGFNKEKRIVYIRCTYFLYLIRNADIDLKEVNRGYVGFSIEDDAWIKDDEYYKVEEILEAKSITPFVGRTVFNHRNILTVLEKMKSKVDDAIVHYKFAAGELEEGEFQFPIYKDRSDAETAYAKTSKGHIFNVHSKSQVHPKGITSGACYLCTILNENREIGLNVVSKFGKVRSGLSVSIDLNHQLINNNRFNDIDPIAMECSNVLEYYTKDEDEQEFTEINIFAGMLRDYCISLQMCEDKAGEEKLELLFANEKTEGQTGKICSLRHLPTSKNSPFVEFITVVQAGEEDDDDFDS